MIADLHVHTVLSDGKLNLREIQAQAAAIGVDWVVAADHDLLVSQPVHFDHRHSSRRIYAVEVTAQEKGEDVHVLGYFKYSPGHEFSEFLRSQRYLWGQRFKKVFWKLNFRDWFPSHFDIQAFQSVLDSLSKKQFRSRPDIYREMFAKGKPYHMSGGRFPSLKETIGTINDNGGLSVLAHPGMGELGTSFTPEAVVAAKREWGLRGVEVYSPFHTPEMAAEYRKCAQDSDLVITGGSDFHCGQWQAVVHSEGRGGLGFNYVEGEELDRFLGVLFD